jgi:nuclear transport factor 2 (NTF2) superfamily protein
LADFRFKSLISPAPGNANRKAAVGCQNTRLLSCSQNKEKNMIPEEIIKQAEAAYDALDLDRIIQLFDPQIIVYRNGQKIIEGLEELRKWHEEWIKTASRGDHWVRKTLRAASGDTIAGEWEDYALGDDGKYHRGYGGEFWKMRDGRLLEWRSYYEKYPINET